DYSEQFLYHIHLEADAVFEIVFESETEVAVYLPELPGVINDEKFNAGDFIEFDRKAGIMELHNNNQKACDVIVFG
ncbi:hypothetical protein NL431_28910, partial [Klebsiella pneumoniae]|nr:hypothetical protein [Klebsiella pneumoniae]